MTTPSREEALLDAIAREEARLETLKAELVALGSQPGPGARLSLLPNMSSPTTSVEKVALFRQLFRGRPDVYPKLWTTTATGRKGYAPACANEWDQVILDHLQGGTSSASIRS